MMDKSVDSYMVMMREKPKSSLILSRRRFLSAGLGFAATLALPSQLWAQTDEKNVDKSRIPERKPKPPRVVMIDPGHGGKDPGAIGRHGTYEKDITLDVSKRIAELLQQNNNVVAKLTRQTDIFLPLKHRVEIARDAKVDFFISVHADSAPDRDARGFSAYSLSEKGTDAFARELAKRENSVDEIGGVDLKGTEPDVAAILRDLTARHTRNAALKAKKHIVKGLAGRWQLLDNPMRAANFAVLRAPDVPSLLLETGFLSNHKDEALLANANERQKIARLLAQQITGLLSSPPFA
jgi:N-acetylmuramoyl-L-alanine amidase